MENDRIDRILANEDPLLPSSGFLASVMGRVEEEAAVPPPIPFPLKRALPGMFLAAGVLGWGGVEIARQAAHASFTVPQVHIPAQVTAPLQAAGWLTVSVVLSLAAWLFARRLSGGSGLY